MFSMNLADEAEVLSDEDEVQEYLTEITSIVEDLLKEDGDYADQGVEWKIAKLMETASRIVISGVSAKDEFQPIQRRIHTAVMTLALETEDKAFINAAINLAVGVEKSDAAGKTNDPDGTMKAAAEALKAKYAVQFSASEKQLGSQLAQVFSKYHKTEITTANPDVQDLLQLVAEQAAEFK